MNTVKTSFLSPEELQQHIERINSKRSPVFKEKRAADWRWPQNRKRAEQQAQPRKKDTN
ncbi:hypothetical protein [Bacillus sp. FJAT-52991]|uniref:Uncharacterized protein n=1 Tax=Bacillus kandeliae TaxID=3129297 RepID=A0ABZ2N9X1_9BACI